MIEIFKLKELNETDIEKLNHVSPWWEKNINSQIKKNKRWISKFGVNPKDFIPFNKIEETNYSKLFASTNNYLNFFNPRLKKIKTEVKLFKKFDQMITDYMTLSGFCWGLQSIIAYYIDLETNEISNKKEKALEIGNEILKNKYARYKKEVYSKLSKYRESLDEIFSNELHVPTQLFESKVLVHTVMKYAGKLFKIGKIEQQTFLDISYLCYLEVGFSQSYTFIFGNFVKQILY